MTKPRAFKRKRQTADQRVVKTGCAQDAICQIEHGHDVYILTYGQFSLIDALFAIVDQTGPVDVVLASWTTAASHLEHVSHMMAASQIRSLRMIVDRSFRARQPAYHRAMRELFGAGCIRAFRCHAKFMVITNDDWKIVVRTSMNLNENPRLETIEITEDDKFAAFMLGVVDDIFERVEPDDEMSDLPDIPEDKTYQLARAQTLEFETLAIPETTHVA